MLYQWKFSIIDKDGNTLRTDNIIAPTVIDADFIYNRSILSWTNDEQKVLHYFTHPESGQSWIGGSMRMKNKIKIDCLGEVEVKLTNEIPQHNRVTVLFELIQMDHYTHTCNPPLIINGEFLQWGFNNSNQSIALVKAMDDVFLPSITDKEPIIDKGEILSIFPSQLRFL